MSKLTTRTQTGVSACLASQAVRFDASFITNQFIYDDGISENFHERIFAHYRWRQINESVNSVLLKH